MNEELPIVDALRRLERKLTLPPRAQRIASYQRYYTWGTREGHRVLIGVYVDSRIADGHSGHGSPIHVVASEDELPVIYDGGCAVVNLVVDPVSVEEMKLWCNGVA
jgi:hypothetical protein